MKAAEAMIVAAGVKPHDIESHSLLPNPPQKPELTLEQQAAAFELFANSHNAKTKANTPCQPIQSPCPTS